MSRMDQSYKNHQTLEFSELIKISALDEGIRKDIVRGIYFYNTGILTNGELPL